jgi:hypothetical protein
LHLGVEADALRHLEVGIGVDVGVAHAGIVLHDGDARRLGDGANQVGSTAWDDDVDALVLPQQNGHRLAVGGRNELHDAGR